MVFSSTVFMFIFLPCVLLGYYLLDRKFKNVFLLIVSLLFYAWGEPKFVFVMIGSILMNYIFALLVDRWRESKYIAKIVIAIMVLCNIIIFFIYKYLDFAIVNINYIFGTSVPLRGIALPIGISFFTFQAISYVLDVYRGNGEVQKNPLNVGLYISFFPQLIAGPIVRYETVAKEIKYRRENWSDFCVGTERFIIGLGKKIILSNSFAIIADYSFNNTQQNDISVLMAWIGAISYTFQIYFDFSGYSDMALGLGRMFGFHFVENFNYPYAATSITDFWRRWHISLSSWFRDYVYFPLGGSRVKTKRRHIFNLFVVWTLTGVWHGASWNFIFWGWFYFAILVFEKLTSIPQKFTGKLSKITYRIFTMTAVVFGWVLFRAENLTLALIYIQKMLGINNTLVDDRALYILNSNLVVFLLGALLATPIVKMIEDKCKMSVLKIIWNIVKSLSLLLILGICICSIVSSSYNPFIYFNF